MGAKNTELIRSQDLLAPERVGSESGLIATAQ